MKRILLIVLGAALLAPVFSQNNVSEDELIRSHFNLAKKALVADAMQLSNEQAAKFWPVYEKYNREAVDLTNMRIKYIKEYASKFDHITAEEADNIMKRAFRYNKKVLVLEQRYYKLMKKELGVAIAARFIHVEEYIHAAVKLDLLDTLPLLHDVKKKQ